MAGAAVSEDGSAVVSHSTLTYRVCRAVCGAYLRFRHRLRTTGSEHLPATGGALIVANHQSFLDIPIMAATTGRHISFVARDSLKESRILSFIMRESGVVLVKRGAADRAALREMQDHLAAGDLLLIFPEGTRTRDGQVGEFKAGALLAARKAGVPLIPAGIRGSFGVWPRSKKLPGPGRLEVRYGPPIDVSQRDALDAARGAILEAVGDGSCSG